MMKGKGSGWKGESRRHSLARKGIKTAKGMPNGMRFSVDQFRYDCCPYFDEEIAVAIDFLNRYESEYGLHDLLELYIDEGWVYRYNADLIWIAHDDVLNGIKETMKKKAGIDLKVKIVGSGMDTKYEIDDKSKEQLIRAFRNLDIKKRNELFYKNKEFYPFFIEDLGIDYYELFTLKELGE